VLGRREGVVAEIARYFDSVFQYLMMPSMSVEPLSATPLAISSIASMPAGDPP